MKNTQLINKLKELLESNHQTVGDIEFTSGNYDNEGELIENKVPTITTDFCEIGCYENTCYFTVILYPESFSQELLEQLKEYDNMHVYGFKNFLEDLYPKEDFSYEEFEKNIRKDEYVQVQFDFDIKEKTTEKIINEYLKLKEIFLNQKAQVINQLTHKFQ